MAILGLLLILKGEVFNALPLNTIWDSGFYMWHFSMLNSFLLVLAWVFYDKKVLSFVMIFCIHTTMCFSSFYWCVLLHWSIFQMVSHSKTRRPTPAWSWYMIILMCFWLLFAHILWRNFSSLFFRDICLGISFRLCLFFKKLLDLQDEFENSLNPSIFCRVCGYWF